MRTPYPAVAGAALLFVCGTGTGAASAAAPASDAPSGVTAPAAVVAVDDGGFEYPAAPVNAFQSFQSGESIGPWSVSRGGVDLIGRGYWQAADGGQSVDLNRLSPGTVSQTFATTRNRTYTVTYALAGNVNGAPSVKTGRVLVDGAEEQRFSFDTTGKSHASMGWSTQRFAFVATGENTTLTFSSTTPGANGPAIDKVKIHSCKWGCGCD
ncbi:choice-of-anchor C family protein [Streptomyces sp. NPDC018584]|uniref:choice-of-anchor C family protein n=1 Tax=unclassified Streptomyces TaxID=2593676 RepID=UPI0037B94F1A